MKKFLSISVALVATAFMVSSCSCYKALMKKTNAGVTVSCSPEVLTLKGDNVVGTVTFNIPAKAFSAQGVIKVTPVLVSSIDGARVAGSPKFFQGEKVKDNYTVINSKVGGAQSLEISIPYTANMRLSRLVLSIEGKCLKGGKKIKEFTALPDEKFV
ncbi:MAG: hypothetical protein RSA50_04735, partial [Mucinivorans sp.]